MFASESWDMRSKKRDRACVRVCVCVCMCVEPRYGLDPKQT